MIGYFIFFSSYSLVAHFVIQSCCVVQFCFILSLGLSVQIFVYGAYLFVVTVSYAFIVVTNSSAIITIITIIAVIILSVS